MHQTVLPAFLTAVFSISLAMAAPLALAQQSEEAPSDLDVAEEEAEITREYLRLLELLEQPAEEIAESVAEITEALEGTIQEIRDAPEIFDRMISAVEKAAETSAPDGDFVAAVDLLMVEASKDAARARELGDEELAKQLEADVEFFEGAKARAIELYSSSFRNIRDIKRQKELFVIAYKAKKFALARQSITRALDQLETIDEGLSVVKETLPIPDDAQAQ